MFYHKRGETMNLFGTFFKCEIYKKKISLIHFFIVLRTTCTLECWHCIKNYIQYCLNSTNYTVHILEKRRISD